MKRKRCGYYRNDAVAVRLLRFIVRLRVERGQRLEPAQPLKERARVAADTALEPRRGPLQHRHVLRVGAHKLRLPRSMFCR